MTDITIPNPLKGAMKVSLPAGTRVFQSGDACRQFFFLISGKIRVDLTSKSGKSIMLYRFGADETCILTTSCLLSGDDYCAEAHVEEDVEALVLPIDQFQQRLDQSHAFRQLVFDSYSRRLIAMMAKIEDVAFVPIERRLAERVIELADQDHRISATHEQLAHDLGSAREVISRKLSLWQKHGLIERSRGAFQIVDMAGIHNLASLGD
ncbi:MAG: Crp/Fnr family transcriptional regulator [Pseudomonadota bacterium]